MKVFGMGPTIEFDGRHLEVSPLNMDMVAKLEAWVEGLILSAAAGKGDRIEAMLRSQDYSYGSSAFEAMAATEAGIRQQLYLMLAAKQPDITIEQVDALCASKGTIIHALVRQANETPPRRRRAGSQPLKLADLCAILAGEPYYLSLDQIAKLTPYQVQEVYFHERDDKGSLKLDEGKQASPRQMFFARKRRFGLPDWRIAELWAEHQQQQAKPKQRRGRRA